MHIFTGADEGVSGMRDLNAITAYASAATTIQVTVADLICQGVAHRFPELKFVCAEWNTGWLAHWLERLDHAFYRSRSAAPAEVNLLPSEYWRRQFYATFEDDAVGVLSREQIGVTTLLFGNDYPHHDSIWPNSRRVLNHIFEGVSASDRHAMTVGNLTMLYGRMQAQHLSGMSRSTQFRRPAVGAGLPRPSGCPTCERGSRIGRGTPRWQTTPLRIPAGRFEVAPQ